ncbi:phage head-tail joining protein [Marinovum sp.]|uniref:phage head-tail joining protein n=1 Tax=Marinovum sp. TaxID=2024839 RepID=UPI002B266C5A|nr:hypothetical protein [Marinovum sp.]
MAYTEADVTALKSALAKGVRKTKFGNEEVEFNSAAEMRKQLAIMQAEIAGAAVQGVTVSYPKCSRGL